jgi:hypothetical protein
MIQKGDLVLLRQESQDMHSVVAVVPMSTGGTMAIVKSLRTGERRVVPHIWAVRLDGLTALAAQAEE